MISIRFQGKPINTTVIQVCAPTSNAEEAEVERFYEDLIPFFFFLSFLFYIGVKLINNVVILSGEQQRDTAIHTHVSILPPTPLPSRLPHILFYTY